jgi:hypothetical protein
MVTTGNSTRAESSTSLDAGANRIAFRKTLSMARALSGAPSDAIDMLGLSRAFLTLLIATAALHFTGCQELLMSGIT